MLRRLFRLGFKLGLVGALAFAISKAVRGRAPQVGSAPVLRAVADAPPKAADAWTGAAPAEPAVEVAPAAVVTATAEADAWIEPEADGGCAASHPIKAKLSSSIFHQPGGMNYDRTRADRCYLDAAAAEADGLRAAKRRLPRGVFDYIDGAAEDEVTLAANEAAFRSVQLAPRVLRDVSQVDLGTTLLGRRVPAPLALSPTGFTRIAHPEGEVAVARAAAARGLPYTLSTLSTRSIEEVAAASAGPKWFQVYVWRDRGLVKDMVQRAEAEGYEALVLTIDTAVFGRRERDVRRGFTMPPTIGLSTLLDGASRPAWTWAFVRSDPITFANIRGDAARDGTSAVTLSDFMNEQFDPGLTWDDVAWLRSITQLPVILKGVGDAADVGIARSEGLPAVILSNHGGRQLDGAPASLDLLEASVQQAQGDVELIVDGGIRRGRDVVAAVAMGATACMIGRPYLYGLGAAGERGVGFVLDQLLAGMERTMALVGVPTVGELSPEVLRRPSTT